MTAAEIQDLDWNRIEILTKETGWPKEFIERGFEASRRAGIKPEYFINKYLYFDDIEDEKLNAKLEEQFKEILKEQRKAYASIPSKTRKI